MAEGARSGYTARMLRAVIFDMDGLLFDTERLCCDAWREVAAEAGYEMRDELFRSCVGRNSRDTREMVMAECGPSFPYDEFNDRVRVRMRGLMAKDGPPEKPGVRALFSYLGDRGVPFALATSTSERSARWMLERAGLADRFAAFAFGGEVERGKPEPDIFLLARDRLAKAAGTALAAEGIAVFEDSAAGIRAALAAGMRPVFVPDMVDLSPDLHSRIWRRIDSLAQAASDGFFADFA